MKTCYRKEYYTERVPITRTVKVPVTVTGMQKKVIFQKVPGTKTKWVKQVIPTTKTVKRTVKVPTFKTKMENREVGGFKTIRKSRKVPYTVYVQEQQHVMPVQNYSQTYGGEANYGMDHVVADHGMDHGCGEHPAADHSCAVDMGAQDMGTGHEMAGGCGGCGSHH